MVSFTGKAGRTVKPIGPWGGLSRLKGLAIVVPILFFAATLAGWICAGGAMANSSVYVEASTTYHDLYVMDVTGKLKDESNASETMANVTIEAWVLKKLPSGPVEIIDTENEKKYVFPEDGNWTFPEGNWTKLGMEWAVKAYEEMESVTVYLKTAKGVPVAIEASPQLKSGQWAACPLYFDPVSSTISGCGFIGSVPYKWVPRNFSCNSTTCFASPNGRARTANSTWSGVNGTFLIHIVNPVNEEEPVIFTFVNATTNERKPLNNIVEGDGRVTFNRVYNYNSNLGVALGRNFTLATVQEIPAVRMNNDDTHYDMDIRVISFPVKKVYYIDDSFIPDHLIWNKNDTKYNVTRPCEAMVEMVRGYHGSGSFPAVCWHTPEAAVTADNKGIHSSSDLDSVSYAYDGHIKAVVGGHAMMERIDKDDNKTWKYDLYMFGEAFDAASQSDNITLTPNGPNKGWYLLYNWNNATAANITGTPGIDYVIYPSENGFRTANTTTLTIRDINGTEHLEGGVIIHVNNATASVIWPVDK